MFLFFTVTLSVDCYDGMLSGSLRNGNILKHLGGLCVDREVNQYFMGVLPLANFAMPKHIFRLRSGLFGCGECDRPLLKHNTLPWQDWKRCA